MNVLTALKPVSPSKSKCTGSGCGQFLQDTMKMCWNCGKQNENYNAESFEIHRRGYRAGWKQNAETKLSELSPSEEKLLSQVDDIMKEMNRKTASKSKAEKEASESKQECAPGPSSSHEDGKDKEAEQEAEEDSGEAEWNLNSMSDCVEMFEESFPAADVEKAGYKIGTFKKICEFYLQGLKAKTPKASLAHWVKKDLDSGILKTSKQRVDWLKCYGKMRSLEFLPKKWGQKSVLSSGWFGVGAQLQK